MIFVIDESIQTLLASALDEWFKYLEQNYSLLKDDLFFNHIAGNKAKKFGSGSLF